jgi:hypothetical protein
MDLILLYADFFGVAPRFMISGNGHAKEDGFPKSPISVFCCILRHCGVRPSTPRSSGFARLELGTFCFALSSMTYHDFIKDEDRTFESDTPCGQIHLARYAQGLCHQSFLDPERWFFVLSY